MFADLQRPRAVELGPGFGAGTWQARSRMGASGRKMGEMRVFECMVTSRRVYLSLHVTEVSKKVLGTLISV